MGEPQSGDENRPHDRYITLLWPRAGFIISLPYLLSLLLATGGLYEATAQGIRRIQRWWSGAPKSEEEEEIELNPSTIAAIKKWWNKTSEEKEE